MTKKPNPSPGQQDPPRKPRPDKSLRKEGHGKSPELPGARPARKRKTDAPGIRPRHQVLLDNCRPVAVLLLQELFSPACLGGYRDAVTQLARLYVTELMECTKGRWTRKELSAKVATNYSTLLRVKAKTKTGLTPAALRVARDWARSMAVAAVSYTETVWVFRRSLIDAAILHAGGNRWAAARLLKVHRNTTQLPPDPPAVAQTGAQGSV